MCHAVVVEVAAGREPFAADLTLVRFLATVDAPVRVETAGRREPFVADHADVWLLTWNQRECDHSRRTTVRGG